MTEAPFYWEGRNLNRTAESNKLPEVKILNLALISPAYDISNNLTFQTIGVKIPKI